MNSYNELKLLSLGDRPFRIGEGQLHSKRRYLRWDLPVLFADHPACGRVTQNFRTLSMPTGLLLRSRVVKTAESMSIEVIRNVGTGLP